MKNVYLLGIGGIGMSALARYFNNQGCKVSGYDRTETKLTKALVSEGIDIHYIDDIEAIPKDKEDTFVIYTPAIPKDLEEYQFILNSGYKICKRSKALGEIAASQTCLAVAGTHGKTTTSTLLAHIFTHSEEGCSAFLGGISKNYHTNLLLSKVPNLVAEADEFDRSFLQLFPEIAVITSTDADHLDIYDNHNNIKVAFAEFASQVKEDGAIVLREGLDIETSKIKAKIYHYSFDSKSDFFAQNIKPVEGGYFSFDLIYPKGVIENCTVGIPGWINVENGIAAAAIALLYGLSPEKVKLALASYQGVERRFDMQVNSPKVSYIDDYAHHPKEIAAAVSSIRNIFPDRKLCAIFQPHLYSRTRDFAEQFAESLNQLDSLILLDIYPAREEPIEGVTSKIIFDRVTLKDKVLVEKSQLMAYLANQDIDILITFGAGDIDKFIQPIKNFLKERYDV